MNSPTPTAPWYIEVRSVNSPEKISLDLARHLPRRSLVGPILVVTSRPPVMLPVIRKRWMIVIREVERQHSSTLDRTKRESLRNELTRLQQITFAANTAYIEPPARIIFTAPEHAYRAQRYSTLYLLTMPSQPQLQAHVHNLTLLGLIVSYCGLPLLGGSSMSVSQSH